MRKKIIKKNQNDLTAIVLTYNEEKHIERCIISLKNYVKNIILIDSFSSDKTIEIAKKYKVKFYKRKFINQSKQINWGLKNIRFKTKWLLRIDADEYLTCDLKKKLTNCLQSANKQINSISFERKIKFLNKLLNYGATSPHKTLRVWRNGKGYCDKSLVDEQIITSGKSIHINGYLIDHNLKSLSWWLNKHKKYAIREANDYILKTKTPSLNLYNLKIKPFTQKNHKYKIYYKLPIILRPLIFFFYSYIIKLGFLTGWQGFIFYFFQTLWFRFMVDLNIIKIKIFLKKNYYK